MFRKIRITILLIILAGVALGTWLDRSRSTDWDKTLWVAVYPIAVQDNAVVNSYIQNLSNDTFADIGEFLRSEGERYGVKLSEPARVRLYGRITTPPPEFDHAGNMLTHMLWSLRLRYWAWRASSAQQGPTPDVRIFVLYHDPAISPSVPHSLGLQKGLLGVVHAFAEHDMTGANNSVIAHEFLHTLGATDKYDANNLAVFPDGYADPNKQPLYPQDQAEIMAGRRMLSEQEAEMPARLRSVVVGTKTAREIGWTP